MLQARWRQLIPELTSATLRARCIPALQKFDELLLLKRGGETLFCGELGAGASKLVAYLQAFQGVEPMPRGWVL